VNATRRDVVAGALAASIAGDAQAEPNGRVKRTDFIRLKGASKEEFRADVQSMQSTGWSLVAKAPGIAGLVLNLVDAKRSPRAPFDVMIENWFVDERAAANDAAPRDLSLYTREVTMRAPAPGSATPRAKRIGLVGRAPSMSQAQFFDDWEHVHAPPVLEQPHLERYVLNMASSPKTFDAPPTGGGPIGRGLKKRAKRSARASRRACWISFTRTNCCTWTNT
jgi:hypothetical protein